MTSRRLLILPIRWRLTLWYAALLMAALLLFGGGLYLGLRQRLYASLDEQLQDRATAELATVRFIVRDGTPVPAPIEPDPADAELFRRVFDGNGGAVSESAHEGGEVPGDDAVTAALGGETRFSTVPVEDGESMRLLTAPIRTDGRVVGALQVGLDRDEVDGALATLLGILALAGPLVLLVAAGGGYLLAGRALAPVAAITTLAGRIDGNDLDTRLDLDLPDDELGRLARTFDAMLARIEDAFARQRRFTGDAAHELRTPLTLMRSQVDLALARPRTADDYREALRELDGDLERLTGLVATLLTLARADAGRLAPDRALFDLNYTIASIIEHYAAPVAAATISLVDASTPTPLVADEDLLTRALINLVDNALAHTPAGGSVTVGCQVEGATVRLWVADTGGGIDPEHQARVFDRFYRVDAGRARAHGGAGLGLAICKAIAEAHGGTIGLESQVGQGTRVELLLPTSH
ncbi:MAG: HAMP domain-containing protein [Chloroflexia bacterium]|nr:HAMP domain-containing protein [Chloroflexia bacterium]